MFIFIAYTLIYVYQSEDRNWGGGGGVTRLVLLTLNFFDFFTYYLSKKWKIKINTSKYHH